MSFQFSANQFNEPFKAKRLRNWSYGINHPGSFPRRRCGYTIPIANANGHLLPCIKRSSKSSPWGDYRGWIWEETSTKCDCVDRIRRPEDYDRPPCNIMVARESYCPTTEAKATSHALASRLFQPQPKPEVVQVLQVDVESDSSPAAETTQVENQNGNGEGEEIATEDCQ